VCVCVCDSMVIRKMVADPCDCVAVVSANGLVIRVVVCPLRCEQYSVDKCG